MRLTAVLVFISEAAASRAKLSTAANTAKIVEAGVVVDGDAAILAIIVPIAAATRLQALAHDFERVLVSR